MNLRTCTLAGLLALSAAVPAALVSSGASAQQSPYAVPGPRIDGFDVRPAARLSPGNEMKFTLHGSPGGSASLRIDGGVDRFPLEEVEPGVYEGIYTIGTRDRITPTSTVTVNLRAGNRIATEILDEPVVAGARRPDNYRQAEAPPAALPRNDRFAVQPVGRLNPGTDL